MLQLQCSTPRVHLEHWQAHACCRWRSLTLARAFPPDDAGCSTASLSFPGCSRDEGEVALVCSYIVALLGAAAEMQYPACASVHACLSKEAAQPASQPACLPASQPASQLNACFANYNCGREQPGQRCRVSACEAGNVNTSLRELAGACGMCIPVVCATVPRWKRWLEAISAGQLADADPMQGCAAA